MPIDIKREIQIVANHRLAQTADLISVVLREVCGVDYDVFNAPIDELLIDFEQLVVEDSSKIGLNVAGLKGLASLVESKVNPDGSYIEGFENELERICALFSYRYAMFCTYLPDSYFAGAQWSLGSFAGLKAEIDAAVKRACRSVA